jgi:hypothetical protein
MSRVLVGGIYGGGGTSSLADLDGLDLTDEQRSGSGHA